eukprot:scpid105572/ scgid26298/ 
MAVRYLAVTLLLLASGAMLTQSANPAKSSSAASDLPSLQDSVIVPPHTNWPERSSAPSDLLSLRDSVIVPEHTNWPGTSSVGPDILSLQDSVIAPSGLNRPESLSTESDLLLLQDAVISPADTNRPESSSDASEPAEPRSHVSSLPEVEHSQPAENDATSLRKCVRVPRTKRISLPSCADVFVDVGQCSGAC